MSHGEVRLIAGKRVASSEYRSWQMMKNRCLNQNAQDYVYYGGRGIRVCDAWEEFDLFLKDMGRKPSKDHTLDRLDNDLGYYKENCRWATRLEQARNRSPSFHKCSLDKAEEIRQLYATGEFYQIELADAYGLTQAHVSQIVRGTSWKGGGE